MTRAFVGGFAVLGLAMQVFSLASEEPEDKKPFSFQNSYIDGQGLRHEETYLVPWVLYEGRHRVVVQTNGKYWVRSGTLLSLNAQSLLPEGRIVADAKTYLNPFQLFVTEPTNLVVRSAPNPNWKRNLNIQVDDEAPVVLLHFLGAHVEQKDGSIDILPATTATIVAYDLDVPLKGVGVKVNGNPLPLFRSSMLAARKPIAFAEPTNQLEVVAEDSLGNSTRREFLVRHDTTPPELEWAFSVGDSTPSYKTLQPSVDELFGATLKVKKGEASFLHLRTKTSAKGDAIWACFQEQTQNSKVEWRRWAGSFATTNSGRVLAYAKDALGNATQIATFLLRREGSGSESNGPAVAPQ